MPAGRLVALLSAVAVVGVLPASASADRYVDEDAPPDAGTCPQTAPCQTIDFALDQAAPGETIFIDGGTYPESVLLGVADITLQGGEFSGSLDPPAIIDPVPTAAAILVFAEGAGAEIAGLNIGGSPSGVYASAPVSVHDNVFEVPADTGFGLSLEGGSAGSSVTGNLFTRPAPVAFIEVPVGIRVADGPATISGNSFVNLQSGIVVVGPGATISGNEFSGHYTTQSGGAGVAVDMFGGSSTVAGNVVNPPTPDKIGYGFRTSGTATAVISRNELRGQDVGIQAQDTVISADSNLIVGTKPGGAAAVAHDAAAAGTPTLNLTNLTTDAGIGINDAGHVNLDSSIVADPFALVGAGAMTCTITFSRGPTTTPGGNGCLDFQTDADPGYVNAGAGDYRLNSASTLIDAGNPTAPAPGARDLDGMPRALPATPNCPPTQGRRDMGAYELFGPVAACPEPPRAAKRCKKKRKAKKRSAASAAKCKKRKRKKR